MEQVVMDMSKTLYHTLAAHATSLFAAVAAAVDDLLTTYP